ncbi:hypothetical protein MOO46_07495 (plasmid) [Apilactobacillus apisilvae]|uniref:Uncharacterized protein n=1 Tax=Apilactobacillus apisilvae TaxID=2923364 RepID=A0ABY4PJX6_9LACO|nr:hypothetical protein [Apilactobacillus apisilvae]UQS85768.1 hypothetical protein MOO46_07495 [Apilactobacillus apisilvae]
MLDALRIKNNQENKIIGRIDRDMAVKRSKENKIPEETDFEKKINKLKHEAQKRNAKLKSGIHDYLDAQVKPEVAKEIVKEILNDYQVKIDKKAVKKN